jgi:short-subunit dehydrogenase
MMQSTSLTWLIGASSGIGEALTDALDQPNHTLLMSARSADKLEQIAASAAKGQRVALPLDITDSAQCDGVVAQVKETYGCVDRVVFNAGTCEYMNGDALEQDAIERVLQTNFLAITALTNQVMPLLLESVKQGRTPQLVFVGSSVTYLALPRAAAYGASKAALRYFAESIYNDLIHLGIDVRMVSPGFVKTPLTDKNDFPMPFLLSAEEAAERIASGLRGNRFDIHFPRRLTWLLKGLNALPIRWRFALTSKSSRLHS